MPTVDQRLLWGVLGTRNQESRIRTTEDPEWKPLWLCPTTSVNHNVEQWITACMDLLYPLLLQTFWKHRGHRGTVTPLPRSLDGGGKITHGSVTPPPSALQGGGLLFYCHPPRPSLTSLWRHYGHSLGVQHGSSLNFPGRMDRRHSCGLPAVGLPLHPARMPTTTSQKLCTLWVLWISTLGRS